MKNPWLISARPKTLPLAISGVLLAFSFALQQVKIINWYLFVGVFLVASGLQILSNFANDYGDFQKGTDKLAKRNDRMLTTGAISQSSMKLSIWMLSVLVFLIGVSTLYYSYSINYLNTFGVYGIFALGVLAIAAALMYTIGKKAYGYYGFGDLMVFLFFGLVPVLGGLMVFGGNINIEAALGAVGVGALSVAVLNTNNYRDLKTDKKSKKHTIAVQLGEKNTIRYQKLLLVFGFLGVVSSFVFHVNHLFKESTSTHYLEMLLVFFVFLPTAVFLSRYFSEMQALKPGNREEINPLLKRFSLTTLLLCGIHLALSLYLHSIIGPF